MNRNPLNHANEAGIIRAFDYQQERPALEEKRDAARVEILRQKEELRNAPNAYLKGAALLNLRAAARRLAQLMEAN